MWIQHEEILAPPFTDDGAFFIPFLKNTLGPMSDRIRRGMLIKNNGSEAVEVSMSSRQLRLEPGAESFITPEEVRDPTLRAALQERSIAIVRPATPAEDEALRERLDEQ